MRSAPQTVHEIGFHALWFLMHSRMKISRLPVYLVLTTIPVLTTVLAILWYHGSSIDPHLVFVLLAPTAALLVLHIYIFNRLKVDVEAISISLARASTELTLMDLDKLSIHEFVNMSKAANLMAARMYRAEHALIESEARFGEMLEKVGLAVVALDRDGKVTFCNDFLLETTGWTSEEVIGESWFEKFTPPEIRGTLLGRYYELEFPEYHEYEILTKSGGRRLIAWNDILIRDHEGKVVGCTAMGQDITEKKRSEMEHICRVTAMEQLAEAVVISDRAWLIRYVNPAFEKLSGYSKKELQGRHVGVIKSENSSKALFEPAYDTLLRGETWSGRLTHGRKNGTTREAEVTVYPIRDRSGQTSNYVSIHRDITDLLKLEKDLHQARKLEPTGTFTREIIHNFNNLLTAMIGYTEMALLRTPEESPLYHDLARVLKAGEQARDLLKRILDLSTAGGLERKPSGRIAVNPGRTLTGDKPKAGTSPGICPPGFGGLPACPEENGATPIQGRERIFFVDDENELAELGKEMLETLGYRVTIWTSSIEALESVRIAPYDIDLVITDMTMPSMTGLEMSREILKVRPDLPIILCTGYSDGLNETGQKETGIKKVLLKPFEIGNLAKAIREILDR